jgi:hypothetical protein
LICTSNEVSDISYYPEHLPDLGNGKCVLHKSVTFWSYISN